jgi:hypothetical protein
MATNNNKKGSTSLASGSAAGSGSGSTAAATVPIVGTLGSVGTSTAPPQSRPPKGFRLKMQQFLAGAQSVLPAGSSLPGINAAPMTQASIVAELNTGLSAYGAVDAQVTALKTTRAQLQAQLPGLRTYCEQLRNALVAFFGSSNPQLEMFGLTPKSKATKTLVEKISAVTLGQQTRVMRGTKGAKQKSKIKASGSVVVSTSVSATGTAAPAAGAPGASAQAAVPGTVPGKAGG